MRRILALSLWVFANIAFADTAIWTHLDANPRGFVTPLTLSGTGTSIPSLASVTPSTDATTSSIGSGSAWLASAYTNATTSFTNTNLVLNLAAATTYRVTFIGSGFNNTGTSGAAFTFVIGDATGCTMRFNWSGATTAATALTSGTTTSSGAASPTFWNTAAGSIREWVSEEGIIGGCTNATTIRVQGEAITSGTITLDSFASLKIEKLGGAL